MEMAHGFQHPRLHCSSGSHGWEGSKDFNPRQSNLISPTYGQPTLTWACPSLHVSRQCSNASSEASKDTWGSAKGDPSCPSYVTCSHRYLHRPPIQILSASSISRLPLPQPSQDSLGAGSSPCIQAGILTQASTS